MNHYPQLSALPDAYGYSGFTRKRLSSVVFILNPENAVLQVSILPGK